MNQNFIKTIGIYDEPRKDSHLVYVNQADGLKGILNRDFDEWSNFDSWESISVQQWIFSRALEIFRGMKIDVKCDCCENNDLIPNDFESIKKEKCYGKKSAFMIEKVLDEKEFSDSVHNKFHKLSTRNLTIGGSENIHW